MRLAAAVLPLVLACLLAPALLAEKAPTSPAGLREQATHVVRGKVRTIYTRTSRDGGYRLERHVAEIEVLEVEKGTDLTAGGLVYARYWERTWVAPGYPPPGTNGHTGLPAEGETLRIYLARNARDGFGETKDGGYNVLGRNGFERPASDDAE